MSDTVYASHNLLQYVPRYVGSLSRELRGPGGFASSGLKFALPALLSWTSLFPLCLTAREFEWIGLMGWLVGVFCGHRVGRPLGTWAPGLGRVGTYP